MAVMAAQTSTRLRMFTRNDSEYILVRIQYSYDFPCDKVTAYVHTYQHMKRA